MQGFFRPKTGDLQKKNEMQGFFRPKTGDLQKKKVFTEISRVFAHRKYGATAIQCNTI